MDAALLLLADSRLPAGGHAHSGGVEEAVRVGAVTGPDDLARFLRGRLATAGLVAAALAAAACELGSSVIDAAAPARRRPADLASESTGGGPERTGGPPEPIALWRRLDAEADARTSSPAQREAARTQGRLLVRTARRIWPSPVLETLAGAVPEGAHHPIALGAAAAAAGCDPGQAALAATYSSVTGPATAAVRLLGLDPVTVHRLLADLAPSLDETARAAHTAARPERGAADPESRWTPHPDGEGTADPDLADPGFAGDAWWAALPAAAAPALDLLAENHLKAGTRLFVS
ncbi:urease accessory protein UreF [Microtetraspora fusca]|uniref:urease accessory protein UreF n=1 Tax=Microtetraspora fusca TaxID=1997 RepID=UPI000835BA18|nr:urease accessory UreF family protein [Microtetraspora fusca]